LEQNYWIADLPVLYKAEEDRAAHMEARIQVPDNYTFWGLHVAIQSAMG